MRVRRLIAHNMRKQRVALGLSQEQLAVDAGIDRTYVSRLERCLENPSVGVLERVAVALRIEVAELLKPPKSGEGFPKPLRGGRKPRRVK